ncbi:hypothetical protein E9549_07570 [Blastococcus sp. MG754426]|uniref:hypothetical protein n=1 Tax=unclassified Blastococcus TaxID=2619396 RepID=UPI001EF05487|nr:MULTISPECIES: hypothetical protein [unclassified Blastococcus]MCF6507266.1 hypothetical protein [Blastococcus sp. MG754426]MCF6511882.1 hypothetical protein [Blastococcus sp. MG754427]MCF6734152.1 hypothetical protein [Blastococcus sp. KM273129]
MRTRRPFAALLTSLALLGGGASMTACGDPAGLDRNDGTPEEVVDTVSPEDAERENLPDVSNPEIEQNTDDDTQDPD